MRITFALPKLDGLSGGLRVAAQYAAHLRDRGHQVTLVCRRPEPVRIGKRLAIRRFLGLARTPPFAGHGHFAGTGLPVVQLDDHRPVRPDLIPDADLIVSTWWTTAEWADRLPAQKGVHVHFIQGHENFENLGRSSAPVYRQNNHKLVVAGWLVDVMRTEYHRTSRMVGNGVDTAHFHSPRRERGAPPRVGFMYGTHPCKNVPLAIAAVERLKAARPDLRVLSFGIKPRPADLPDWVDYEQRPDQARIPQIYAACDVWLFTSDSEGFGLPLLEAMASRTPVVATRAGAASDLIDGLNGRLVASDPEAVASAALELLESEPAAWRAVSDAALATAETHDLRHAAARFEAALVDILAASLAAEGETSAAGESGRHPRPAAGHI